MTDQARRWPRWASLRVRVAVLLSIAILPLGIIAVLQTAAVVRETLRLERADLLARTVGAVNTETALLRQSFGAAEALGTAALSVGAGDLACPRMMGQFVDTRSHIIFAGFIEADGTMRCASTSDTMDFSAQDDWRDFAADPRPMVSYSESGEVTGVSVLIATVPVFDEAGAFAGGLSVSVPGALVNTLLSPDFDGVKLALLQPDGVVLAASVDAARIERLGIVPAELDIRHGGYTQDITERDGDVDLVAVSPLINERLYVVGVWEARPEAAMLPILGTGATLFPLLMWIVALGVALFAVDRLVLRHLRLLNRRMAGFSFKTPGDSFAVLDGAPDEIRDIANAYNLMIDRILSDRTELAVNLTEKELLLREVHHRVKNNLQLIASMLNIQIRSISDGNSRQLLRRMQDRVMGLSSIHKALYAGSTLARVRADQLLRDVLQTTVNVSLPAQSGVKVAMQFDPITIDPDQAVPLTLLAAELVTNAVKYVGRAEDGEARIWIALDVAEPDVVLTVRNTVGTAIQEDEAQEGSGLGAQLIEAFVSQLGGDMTQDAPQSHYAVRVAVPDLSIDGVEDDNETDEDDIGNPDLRQVG